MAKRELQNGKLPGMSEEEFSSAVLALRDDARNWIDDEVRPHRERAWKYYNGAVDKQTDKGRSKAVLTEVRDAVESVVVSLLRIFLSTRSPVEFTPRGPEDIELAAQQTEAVNHVFYTQNPGFRVLSDVFRDALVAKTGALRVWWDHSSKIEETTYEGLTEVEYSTLASQPDTEILEFSVDAIEDETELDDLALDQGPPVEDRTFSVRIRRTFEHGQVRVAAIPPEEVIFNKSATSVEDATIIGQDGTRKAQDVVNEGLATWSEVEGHFASLNVSDSDERALRSGLTSTSIDEEEVDIANREVRVSELYIRLDKDGDGIPELRRVIILGGPGDSGQSADGEAGAAGQVISDEVWDAVPIFLGSPFPLPHNIIGMGISDLTTDLQDVSTSIQRAMLDSLYAAVNPRYTAITNQVNIPDLARNRFNDVIRVRTHSAVQPLVIPFVGRDALPVLEYMDQRKEARTGVSRASLGLDPDALQSSTAIGVNATITAAQAKVESIARSLAEQMIAPAFREINRLLTHYQDKPLMVRMRGKFVPIATDGFVVDMDVVTNVGLGRGSEEQRLEVLAQIMAKQELILTTVGADNPIVTMSQYANTLTDMVDLSPLADPARYFNPPGMVDQLVKQKKQKDQQNPPQQDPVIQAKLAKLQADAQLARQKAEAEVKLAQDKAKVEMQLAQQKAQAAVVLERFKAEEMIKLKHIELDAEIRLEEIKVRINPTGPGVGNVPEVV